MMATENFVSTRAILRNRVDSITPIIWDRVIKCMKILLLKEKEEPVDHYELYFFNKFSGAHELDFLPVITHSLLNNSDVFDDLASVSGIIITSKRAVESITTAIRGLDVTRRSHVLSLPVYSVGPATLRLLANLGFENIRGDCSGNAKALLEVIVNDKDITQGSGNLLFLSGKIRSNVIPDTLRQSGLNYIEKTVYQTDSIEDVLPEFEAKKGNWVVFFSSQGVRDIIGHLQQQGSVKIASIGPTTGNTLANHGLAPHIISQSPSPEALFEAIINYTN